MNYKQLTLSEQLMVRMIARLMVLDPVFAEDIRDETSEEVYAEAEAFSKEMAEVGYLDDDEGAMKMTSYNLDYDATLDSLNKDL